MSTGRICLAYSGGLDTSIILKWLVLKGYNVVCYLCDVGQADATDSAAIEEKARLLGAECVVVENLQEVFVEQLIFRAVQCNAIFEDKYLLGTALARPVIARGQVRTAEKFGCQFVAHGCTGKGNDQIRFELAFKALNPELQIIAPWRMAEFCDQFQGRKDLLKFAIEHNIPVSSSPKSPWSMDENLAHCSFEAGILEDPNRTPPKDLWKLTIDPLHSADIPTELTIDFDMGIPVKVVCGEQKATESLKIFKLLTKVGHDHGVGRIGIVENRLIGIKSRGCYESPGLTILRHAHIDLEGLVMDAEVRDLRDQFVKRAWSRQLYAGLYFSPEREFIENSILFSQRNVIGQVRMMVYVLGRSSDLSLYDEKEASMDSLEGFSPSDSTGFIEITGLRLKKFGLQKQKDGQPLSWS